MEGSSFKHFAIQKLIGRGGMGEVYLATDTTLERRVALKFLPRSLTGDPAAQGRLLDEARSCSRVQHPNIAVIHSIEEDGGVFAIVMEYVEGHTLRDVIRRQQLSLQRVTRIGRAVAAGMLAAHDQGIVHRDLKPANVMLTTRGEVKIMDFGLALRPERIVNTMGSTAYGTVGYMSPEQARGDKPGPPSDIFAYGTLLYELLTREAPFKGDNDLATLQAILNEEPIPLRDLRRDTPPALESMVRKCMRKDIADRFQSMHEVAEELRYVEPVVDTGPKDLISELAGELNTIDQPTPPRRGGKGPMQRTSDVPDDGLPPMAPLLSVPMSGATRRGATTRSKTRGTSSLSTAPPTEPRVPDQAAMTAAQIHQEMMASGGTRPYKDVFVGPPSKRVMTLSRTGSFEAAPSRGVGKSLFGLLIGLLLAAAGFFGLLKAAGVSDLEIPKLGGKTTEGSLTPKPVSDLLKPEDHETAKQDEAATEAEAEATPEAEAAPTDDPAEGEPSGTGDVEELSQDHGGSAPEDTAVEIPTGDADPTP